MSQSDLSKKREILFAKFPPGQVPEAADELQQLAGLNVEPGDDPHSLGVGYDLTRHTLRELDEHLIAKGFHLDNSLLSKLTRALIYYIEDIQLHNIGAPERRLKRSSQEAYGNAWEQHPHGDHDETPPEWRDYK